MSNTIIGQLSAADDAISLAKLAVEAVYRQQGRVIKTSRTRSNSRGGFRFKFADSLFSKKQSKHPVEVSIQVYDDDRLLPSKGGINRLKKKDYKLRVRLDKDEIAGNANNRVHGTVSRADGKPAPKIRVTAFDRDLRSEQYLGKASTDTRGYYSINYPAKKFFRAEKDSADLFIRAIDENNQVLGESEVVYNAKAEAEIDLVLSDAESVELSEYELLLKALEPLLAGVDIADLREDDEHRDFTFLSRETGRDPQRISDLALAHDLSRQSRLPAAVFYGLLRQGLPRGLDALLREKQSSWRRALKSAMAQNQIPAALDQDLDKLLARLERLAMRTAFDEPQPGQPIGPGRLARIAGVSLAAARKFAAFTRQQDTLEPVAPEFWQSFGETPGINTATVDKLRFASVSSQLAGNYAPMVEAMQSIRCKGPNWKRDLGGVSRDDWRELAKETGAAPGFQDPDEYADNIADQIELSYPTGVIAARIAADPELGSPDLAGFFEQHPDLDLLNDRIDDWVGQTDDAGELPELRQALQTLQRTMRIAPGIGRYDVMRGLIANGYTSILPILGDGKQAFAARMMPIVGATLVDETYRNAEARAELLLLTGLRIRDILADPVGSIVPPTTDPEIDFDSASWTRLFGSLNGCDCEHCRSLYSPSAYLVDALQHLREAPIEPAAPGGEPRLLDELFARRPDIPLIQLNCSNSNVPLPYIDLVNEILEDAAAGSTASTIDAARYQTPDPAPGESQVELEARLRAIPQHESAEAATRLASASYPWVLPYDSALEKTWLLADHLGLDLAELSRLFDRGAARITRAQLRLGDEDWRLLGGTFSADEIAGFWGAADFAALLAESPGIDSAPVLLQRTGLSPDELETLASTWFLSADGMAEITLAPAEDADRCDFDSYEIRGLDAPGGDFDAARLDQIHRFIRLARKTGIRFELLDSALREFGHTSIDQNALSTLAQLRWLCDSLGCSLKTLLQQDGASLAWFLQTGDTELSIFADFNGIGDTAALTLSGVIGLLEQWAAFQRTGTDLRELAYILLDRDQVPPVFAPAEDDLESLLLGLHELFNESGALPAEDQARLLIDNLASFFQLSSQLGSRLLRSTADSGDALLNAESDPTRPALDDLLPFMSSTVTDSVPDDAAAYARARQLLRRLGRISRLLTGLGFSAADADSIDATRAENGFLDLNSIDTAVSASAVDLFRGWSKLAEANSIRLALPDGVDLFRLMRLAAQTGSTPGQIHSALNAASGWSIDVATGEPMRDPSSGSDIDVVAELSAALGIDLAGFRVADNFARLLRAVEQMHRWRIPPSTLVQWADPATAAELLSASLESSARAGHANDAAWHEIAAPLMDELRERKRDALVAYLIANRAAEDSTELYAHYLIDPEMSGCMLTTRIVQANASIQLFAQRILMNLEPGLAPLAADAESWQLHWRRWEWMRRYRVWEAGRKVLFYPENWLLPELRDDKSPFFEDFENALLQDEMNADTVAQAYRDYLFKLRDVARLDVRAIYVEYDASLPHAGNADVLHLFARSFTEPHNYFYRYRNLSTRHWSAWENIDLPIEGDHLVPFVFQGQLMLFIPQVRELGNQRNWELGIAISRYRNGRWEAARVGSEKLILHRQAPEDISFRVETDGDNLRLRVYRQYFERAGELPLPDSYSLSSDAFTYNICDDILYLEKGTGTRMMFHPLRVDADGMLFREDDSDGNELYLIEALPASDRVDFSRDPAEVVEELIEKASIFGVFLAPVILAADWKAQILLLQNQVSERPLLNQTPGEYSVVPPHQIAQFTDRSSFVFQDQQRAFLVTPRSINIEGTLAPEIDFGLGSTDGLLSFIGRNFRYAIRRFEFEPLYHPFACAAIERFNTRGFDGLLAPPSHRDGAPDLFDRQKNTPGFRPLRLYDPTPRVLNPDLAETISFEFSDACGLYNWELFFHVPLTIAIRLSQNQRFEEARKWFHYIFDPTDTSLHDAPARFWRVKPFYEIASAPPVTSADWLRRIAAGDPDTQRQLDAWRDDPFNPHAIARLRHIAYMKQVVMAYLENLIAWADDLFSRDTRESVNEAAQLYLLAGSILGPRPVRLNAVELPGYSYAELTAGGSLDDLSNAWLELETLLPAETGRRGGGGDERVPRLVPYFCLPPNEKLLGYRDRVADRLFKIRHCMNIEGQVRELALFEPPIDPGLLVRARAAGIDLRSLLRSSAAELPHYRYPVSLQKALEFCADLRALGGALLSALEKRDAEALGLLRSEHENKMLQQVTRVKDRQIEEARETLESLRISRSLVEKRLDFYASREYRNAAEQAEVDHLHVSHGFEIASQSLKSLASILQLIPELTASFPPSVSFGGKHIGPSMSFAGDVLGIFSRQYAFEASMSAITGRYDRRQDDWRFQAELAERELDQIDRQIIAAEIRLAISEQDMHNHRLQIDQARETETFLQTKFTNEKLYDWMAAQLSALHYQSYQTALDLAQRAQAAATQELGLAPGSQSIVEFGHWESGRKGLLAGERLQHELRSLDARFLELNRRQLEITRHISLQTLDPAALVELRARGDCRFRVPEWLYDLDYPGHYNRRIKSVSLTIPCVTGPYTNVNCTLSLERNFIRYSAIPSSTLDPGPAGIRSIATSSGQTDSGMFELNFRDERYLPFEGAGAVSDWKIELSGKWLDGSGGIVDLSLFDFDTVSDVVLSISYTALADETRKNAVLGELSADLSRFVGEPGLRGFSLRHEFPAEWNALFASTEDTAPQTASFPLTVERFPYLVQRMPIAISSMDVYPVIAHEHAATVDVTTLSVTFAPAADTAATPLTLALTNGVIKGTVTTTGSASGAETPGHWLLGLSDSGSRLERGVIRDIVVVCHFAVSG